MHFFAFCWQDAIIVSEHFCFSTIITLKIIGDIGWRKPQQIWKFDNSSWKALQQAAGQLYAFSRQDITKWLFFCQSYNYFENYSPQMKPQADKIKHTGCNIKCKFVYGDRGCWTLCAVQPLGSFGKLNWTQLWPLRCWRCRGLTQFTRLSEWLHRPLCPKSTHSSHRCMWSASGSASGSLVAVQPNCTATQLDFRRLPTTVTRGWHAASPSRLNCVHKSTKVNRLQRLR